MIDILSISCEIILRWMPRDLIDQLTSIVSGIGFVPSGKTPVSEPMLAQFHVMCRHMASLGHT